ncbi:FAD-dependent oxidoreductase [Nocardioides sp.]|uniref:NAD(P)/FAD-dependent oxidoreductase n=1 Tax=Nocardioides sp. TaxID=35761 RepID=UPI0031FF0A86|nr:ferredoxin reductase [Nocardioides sp.]
MDANIVIVGAGLAGARAAVGLRDGGHRGDITVVGDESHPPYERPALSKDYLQGRSTAEALLVEPVEWYDEHDVTRVEGVAAERLDVAARQVHLADGRVLPYDTLVLATGAEPRRLDIPGAELALTLRRIEDSDALRAVYASSSSVVIVGGGWIGLETAAAARNAGLETTVIERMALPLQHVLGDDMAGYFAELHRRNGVDLRTSTSTDSITGSGPFVVRAGDESFAADVVVMGVGAAPNTALAEAAGLTVDNGIQVDALFRTSNPDVYAIGDVANARNTALSTSLRVEHWDNAIRQGRAVAQTILGRDSPFDWQPYFYSDQFDLGMEYVGHGSATDDVVLRGGLSGGDFIAFWLREGRLTAGMNVNVWDVNEDIRALIGRVIDPGALADPKIPLTDLR